jgi:hypothetical protein
MKWFSVLVIVMTFLPGFSDGQTSPVKPRYYDCWYYLETNFRNPMLRNPVAGYTLEFGDSSITVVAKKSAVKGTFNLPENQLILPVDDINKIYIRPKGQKGAGAIIGLVVGASTGLIVGLTQREYSDYEHEGVDVFFTTITCTGIGVALGLTFGSIKKVVRINGDHEKYRQKRPALVKYSIKHYIPDYPREE